MAFDVRPVDTDSSNDLVAHLCTQRSHSPASLLVTPTLVLQDPLTKSQEKRIRSLSSKHSFEFLLPKHCSNKSSDHYCSFVSALLESPKGRHGFKTVWKQIRPPNHQLRCQERDLSSSLLCDKVETMYHLNHVISFKLSQAILSIP